MQFDTIYHGDCLAGLKGLPDCSVDLVIMDPPYVIGNKGGGFWSKATEGNHYNARGTRKGMERLSALKDGFDSAILDELCRVMKKVGSAGIVNPSSVTILFATSLTGNIP